MGNEAFRQAEEQIKNCSPELEEETTNNSTENI